MIGLSGMREHTCKTPLRGAGSHPIRLPLFQWCRLRLGRQARYSVPLIPEHAVQALLLLLRALPRKSDGETDPP
jgi:hypothetical protein